MTNSPLRRGRSLLLLGLLFLTACFPSAVMPSDNLLSKAEERKIGEKVVEQVRHEFEILDDPYVEEYLEDMGNRLAEAMDAQEFEMGFHVVKDPRINAFAVPGGQIFVTSQLILVCTDESELAGVVAHEMGHVEGRHMAHRMQKAARANLAAMAAVLAGAFLGGSPEAGAAITSFGVAGAQAKMLQYSRTDEEDADRRSARALTASGYDAWGMVRFMEVLRRESPAPEGVPAYLFTHPLPANRAAYLADALPSPQEGVHDGPGPSPLWRVQARVLTMDRRSWGLDLFRERVTDYPKSCDARLGLAIIERAQGKYDEALAALAAPPCKDSDDPEVLHERAVTLIREGQVAEGLAELEALRARGAATVPALMDLGWFYLESDDGEKALAVYDELASEDPGWEKLGYYRGLALGKAGREGEAHLSLADYYRASGQPALAARHYREAAQRLPPGPMKQRAEQGAQQAGERSE